MYENFSEFIAAKGQDTIGSVLKKSAITIRWYRHMNYVPRRHWPDLLAEFDDLSIGALRRMEGHAKPSVRTLAREAQHVDG